MNWRVLKRARLVPLVVALILTSIVVVACRPMLGGHLLSSYLSPSDPESRLDYVSITPTDGFSFSVVSDMRRYSGPGEYDTSDYFRSALEL